MTEKRYTKNIHRIYDDNEEIACADTMGDAEILVDRLNEQEERIKELEIGENEIILKQETTINQLINENEQLKKELYLIDKLIEDLGHEEMKRQYEEICGDSYDN